MNDEAAILRKIAALLARAEDEASSPAEVAHAIHIADKLMRRYNLARDDVRLRRETMRRSSCTMTRDESEFANMLAVAIGRLAQCHLTGDRYKNLDLYSFSGLKPDVDYAEWLFRACWSALRQGWALFQASESHRHLVEEGRDLPAIERHYKLGFTIDLAGRIKTLALANAEATGTALICLKNELIVQAFGGAAASVSNELVLVKGNLQAAFESGAKDSRQVGLRQEIAPNKRPRLDFDGRDRLPAG